MSEQLANFADRTRQVAAAATIAALGLVAGCSDSPKESTHNSATTTTVEVATSQEACAQSWEIKQLTTSDHRFVSEGLASIRDAQTPADAREAIQQEWLGIVAGDPETLSGVSKVILNADVNPADLVDASGACASDKAETLRAQLDTTLSLSDLTPDQAPEVGTNSGIDQNGSVVFAGHNGISGNRKAIKVSMPDGRTIWIMERCGNMVTEKPMPGLPTGPTDEGVLPKVDKNTTPAGVPGQNRGSGTAASGPTGPGNGPVGQTPNGQGFVPGEQPVAPVSETKTSTDPNSSTGVPTPQTGVEQNPNLGGNGTPAAPPTSVDTNGGQGGSTGGPGNI